MKKLMMTAAALLLVCMLLMTACSNQKKTESETTVSQTDSVVATRATADQAYDPYAEDNRYDIPDSMFEKKDDVDYGTLQKDVSYYSSVAEDNKQVNVLLPAGYDESKSYPVTYVYHGFGGDHNTHLDTDSYLVLLYGNMLHDGLAKPQIIVGMDMYTDKIADKESKSDEELRFIYDKAIEETAVDLMPFIEKTYAVKTDRENTAIAGMSEGGAKSLCTGFQWLDKFGYIGSFAPDTGVIPTEYYKGTFWNTPVFEKFPQPTAENTPYYLYMTVGSEDPWNIDCTLYYRDQLNEMGVRNQTDYVEGFGHDEDFWRQCFYNFLHKVF